MMVLNTSCEAILFGGIRLKKVYLRYQKQVDSFININKIMLMLEFVLLFVVKGSIDRYNQLPYDWFAYLTTLIHYFLGTFTFFGIILVIECVWNKFK